MLTAMRRAWKHLAMTGVCFGLLDAKRRSWGGERGGGEEAVSSADMDTLASGCLLVPLPTSFSRLVREFHRARLSLRQNPL